MDATKRVEIYNALYTALGPEIIEYITDPDTTEVYINPDTRLWVNYLSRGRVFSKLVIEPKKTLLAIELISGINQKTVHTLNPHLAVEAVLKGIKCRLQIVLPPLVQNPALMIRKHTIRDFTLDDYVAQGVITAGERDYLLRKIKDRKNILVAGSTNSGKTTFTNALLAAISQVAPAQRIVILEDTPELKCRSEDQWRMVTAEYDDPAKCINMNRLLYITMRISPSRIIVGEVRDSAALALLKALNTGHPGGISTTHADTALSALERLELLIQEASPNGDFRPLIGNEINIVVALAYTENGRGGYERKVTEIIEVQGWDRLKQQYIYQKVEA